VSELRTAIDKNAQLENRSSYLSPCHTILDKEYVTDKYIDWIYITNAA